MKLSNEKVKLLNQLIGQMSTDTTTQIISKNDCFLHSKVSVFIPSYGQCDYAITPNHTHPAYSFIYYFQPVNDFIIEGKNMAYDLVDGKCLSAISPDIPHQEIEEEDFQSYIAILIDKELFQETLKQYVDPAPVFRGEIFVPHPELLGALRCFMLEAGDDMHNMELLNYLTPVIAHLVARSVVLNTHPNLPLYDRFEVDQAIAYINSHYSKKITIEILAEQVNRSEGHFSKVFKSVTGMTPIDFLQKIRIQKARNLLINGTKHITEIALECGFNSSSYFSSCFMEKYKMTPSAYRQNFHKKS